MSLFTAKPSLYRRTWVKDLPDRYHDDWDEQGLVAPPINKKRQVVQGVPFYAAQQLHRLNRIPRQLRGATKPLVVTTTKIGEPYYTPQLDFDLRTVRPIPLKYNNLLDPHLKHFFNAPEKKKVLIKRGLVTPQGDVVCHSMKEFNQYRELLYWNYSEMLGTLRKDVGRFMPKILDKRKAIAEVTSEQRRYSLLKKHNKKLQRRFEDLRASHYEYRKDNDMLKPIKKKKKKDPEPVASKDLRKSNKNISHTSTHEAKSIKFEPQEPQIKSEPTIFPRKESPTTVTKKNEAATKIQALFKGYITRKHIARKYKKGLKKQMKQKHGDSMAYKKIWDRTNKDSISTCHTHSCTERLCQQFEITDIPHMMRFLKDPIAQQAYRKHFLLRLMHTPKMDISGTLAAPLLREEIKQHSSKFRWV